MGGHATPFANGIIKQVQSPISLLFSVQCNRSSHSFS